MIIFRQFLNPHLLIIMVLSFAMIISYVHSEWINRAVYSYLFAPPEGGGIEKNILHLGKGKNNLTSILPYIMAFVTEYQGYFMIFPSNFVSKEHFLEYYL